MDLGTSMAGITKVLLDVPLRSNLGLRMGIWQKNAYPAYIAPWVPSSEPR